MNLLLGDLGNLDLRKNLDLLLNVVREAQGQSLSPLLSALAQKDPAILADLVCGPRSPGGAHLARAALEQAEVLEKLLTPRGLYPRLVDLAGDASSEVFQQALDRHPTAGWLVPLSRKVEGSLAGSMHLLGTLEHPGFGGFCHAHGEAGHTEALAFVAVSTGRCEPVAALLAVDPDLAWRCSGELLHHWPEAPLVPYLAEVWGPEIDGLMLRLVPRLRSKVAARHLLTYCNHLPKSRFLLEKLLPGLVERPPAPGDLPT